jgi:hypothetical protein
MPKRQSQKNNPEKLTTYGTQDEEKKNKIKTKDNMMDTTVCKQAQITWNSQRIDT